MKCESIFLVRDEWRHHLSAKRFVTQWVQTDRALLEGEIFLLRHLGSMVSVCCSVCLVTNFLNRRMKALSSSNWAAENVFANEAHLGSSWQLKPKIWLILVFRIRMNRFSDEAFSDSGFLRLVVCFAFPCIVWIVIKWSRSNSFIILRVIYSAFKRWKERRQQSRELSFSEHVSVDESFYGNPEEGFTYIWSSMIILAVS